MSEGNSGFGSSNDKTFDEAPPKPATDPSADAYNSYKIHRTITVETYSQYPKEMTLEEVREDEEELDDIMVSIDGDDDNEVKVTELQVKHA
jgi:hypothetical protein